MSFQLKKDILKGNSSSDVPDFDNEGVERSGVTTSIYNWKPEAWNIGHISLTSSPSKNISNTFLAIFFK